VNTLGGSAHGPRIHQAATRSVITGKDESSEQVTWPGSRERVAKGDSTHVAMGREHRG